LHAATSSAYVWRLINMHVGVCCSGFGVEEWNGLVRMKMRF
jgi:hypothetical protein